MALVHQRSNVYNASLPTNKYLSKTFQSSFLHTPSQTTRRTISSENYLREIVKDFDKPNHQWGRKDSYRGRSFIHLKGTPTGHDMVIVAKGAKHFGSRMSTTTRGAQVQQLYSITPDIKSKTRSNDELIPSPTKIDLQTHIIDKKYPSEHLFKSHIPKDDVFPDTLNNTHTEKDPNVNYIHPADSPAKAPDQIIYSKCLGSPYRHEGISIPLDSQRKPMTWPQGPFYQLPQATEKRAQEWYPTPKIQYPKSEPASISKSTFNVLKEVNDSLWKSVYQKDFSGRAKSAVELTKDKNLSEHAKTIANLVRSKETKVPNIHVSEDHGQVEVISNVDSNNRYSRPLYKGPRPFTTPNKHERSAVTRSIQNPVATSCSCSPFTFEKTGLHRQFHDHHPKIEIPDLRASRNNRELFFEKRHFIPEANNVKSHLIR